MAKRKDKFSVAKVSKSNVYQHRIQDAHRKERGLDWRESNPSSKDFISNKPSAFLEIDSMREKIDKLSPSPTTPSSTFVSGTVNTTTKNLAVTMSDGSIKNINISGLLDNVNIQSSVIDSANKKLVLTLTNGSKVETDISSLINKIDTSVTAVELQDVSKTLSLTMSDGTKVTGNIAKLYDKVSNSVYDATTKKLKLSFIGGTNIETDLSSLAENKYAQSVTVDSSTKKLKITMSDGAVLETDVSAMLEDKFLSSGSVDVTAKKINLTMADGSIIPIDISSMLNKTISSVVVDSATKKLNFIFSDSSTLATDVSSFYDNVNVTGTTIDATGKTIKLTLSNGTNITTDASSFYDNVNTTGVVIDEANKKLKTTLSNGTTIETDITKLLKDELMKTAVVDVANKKATFTMTDNSTIDMDVSELLDNINLSSGVVDVPTKKLNLTLTNGTVIGVDTSPYFDNNSIKSGVVDVATKKLNLKKEDNSIVPIDISTLIAITGTKNHLSKFGDNTQLTETPFIIDDNNNLVYGLASGKQAIHVNKLNAGLILQDKRHTGFSSEVDGQLVNFGTNFNQLGENTRDPNYTGAWFRVDVRTSQLDYNLLTLYHQPPNELELMVFNVGASGKINTNGVSCSVRFNNKVELAPRIDYKHLNTVTTFGNGWKAYSSQTWRATIMRTADGMVNIVGIITDGNSNSDVCVLPPEYRPQRQVLFIAMCQYDQFQRVDIYPNGVLKVSGEGTRNRNGWISLQVSYYSGV